jgi:hypothetical protein
MGIRTHSLQNILLEYGSSSSIHGLESSLEVALESVGRSVLGWFGFISDWVFLCVRLKWLSNYGAVVKLLKACLEGSMGTIKNILNVTSVLDTCTAVSKRAVFFNNLKIQLCYYGHLYT